LLATLLVIPFPIFSAYLHMHVSMAKYVALLAHDRLWFSGKVLFFVITCESVGTVDSMCFPRQQQSAQANEALKQLGFVFFLT